MQSEYSHAYNNGHSDGVKFQREQQKARDAVSPIPEARNIVGVDRSGEFSVTVSFTSCRAASLFQNALLATRGKL